MTSEYTFHQKELLYLICMQLYKFDSQNPITNEHVLKLVYSMYSTLYQLKDIKSNEVLVLKRKANDNGVYDFIPKNVIPLILKKIIITIPSFNFGDTEGLTRKFIDSIREDELNESFSCLGMN